LFIQIIQIKLFIQIFKFHLFSDKATEDAIAQSILKKNMTQLMTIIFKDVLGNDNVGDHEKVQNVAHRFTQTFDRVRQCYLVLTTILNMTQLMTIIFKDVLGNDNVGDHEKVQNVAHRFTQTFDRVKQDVTKDVTKHFSEDVKKTLQKASSNDVTNEVNKDFYQISY
jgi:hypothetical protein